MPEHPAIIAGWERDAAAYRVERRDHSETGLAYGPHPRQTIDLFHPDQRAGERPVIVFLHCGYWRSLHPSFFSHFAAGANRQGYSVAVVGYRLCPEVGVSDIIQDVRETCLFLHRRLRRRLVVCGHSAGAHLAAAMVATDWTAVDPELPAALIRVGLGISGVFDLQPLIATEMNEQLRLDEEGARAVSPALWTIPDNIRFEAWVGGDESAEFLRQSRNLAERWSAAGAHMRFEVIPGAHHFTVPAPLADPRSRMVATLVRLAEAADA